MAAPRFSVGDLVYLVESASLAGSLESYQITGARQGADGLWRYRISIPQKPPTAIGTAGDRITQKFGVDFELLESELCSLCDACVYATNYLQVQLSKVQKIRAAYCNP